VSVQGLERRTMQEVWEAGAMMEYLNAQFLRSVEEGKMVQCFTETGDAAWATFHTSLLTDDEFPLFAVFCREFTRAETSSVLSPTFKRSMAGDGNWFLCGFVDDVALRDPSQPWNQIEPILHVPAKATFVDDSLDRLWISDTSDENLVLEIDTRFWSSLETHAHVFPKEFSNAADRQRAGMNAVPRATRLVSYGYCDPVLRYARLQGQRGPGKAQMLLPLKLDPNSMQTHGAIVVDIIKSRRGGRMYRAVGITSCNEAARSARIIAPITSKWLRFEPLFEEMEVEPSPEPISPVKTETTPPSPPTPPTPTTPQASKDDEKPAYASIANKFVDEKDRVEPRKRSIFPMKVDDWYKDTISTAPTHKVINPKVNLKMLPFDFMQAVCRKLRIDDKILRLSDAPTENEFRIIQAISVEASVWVRGIMSAYGPIDRVYVGVSRRVRCFFAVVSFEKWNDIATRDAILNGESLVVKDFKCRERVYMRLSLEDKREPTA